MIFSLGIFGMALSSITLQTLTCGFALLQRNAAYLGEDRVRGVGGKIWLLAMAAITLFLVVVLGEYVADNSVSWWGRVAG